MRDDCGAGSAERFADGAADAASGAGDDGDFAARSKPDSVVLMFMTLRPPARTIVMC